MKRILTFFFILLYKLPFSQIPAIKFKNFNSENGLPANVIRCVVQDKNGFIWASTEAGLVRFDGYNFEVFRKDKRSTSLSWDHIRDIALDTSTGLLWVSNTKEGIDLFNPRTGNAQNIFKLQKKQVEIPDKFIWFLSAQGAYIWAISQACCYVVNRHDYQIENIISFRNTASHGGMFYHTMVYAEKYMLIFDENGYCRVCDIKTGRLLEEYSPQKTFDKTANNKFRLFYAGNELKGNLLSTSDGIYEVLSAAPLNISKAGRHTLPIPDSLLGFETCLTDKNGNLWMGVEGNGIALLPAAGRIVINKPYRSENSISDNTFWKLMEDREGTIWVPTNYGLNVLQSQQSIFHSFTVAGYGYDMHRIYAIQFINDSLLIVGGYGRISILNTNNGTVEPVIIHSSKVVDRLYCFTKISEDQWLCGYKNGILQLRKNNSEWSASDFTDADKLGSLNNLRVSTIYKMNDTNYLLGTLDAAGVKCWNAVTGIVKDLAIKSGTPNLLYQVKINRIKATYDQNIWIVTDRGIFKLQKNFASIEALTGFNEYKNETLNDISEDAGNVWVTVLNIGLLRYVKKSGKVILYNQAAGLKSKAVYNIMQCSDDKLWITSSNGLVLFNINEEKFITLNSVDGTQGSEYNRFAVCENDAFMAFGGMNGVTIVSKKNSNITRKFPKVEISKITKFNGAIEDIVSIGNEGKFFFNNQSPHIRIYFSTLSYQTLHKTTYEFRLSERDNQWNSIPGQNFIDFYNLPPGAYRLMVRAVADVFRGEAPVTTVYFSIEPKWYQTWWFKLMLGLIIAGLIYGLYLYRIGQIKKQHEIRRNIATDLHDDLGSTLNSVKVFTNLAINGIKQEESLQQAKNNLNEATSGLRDMIWILDDTSDTVDELVTRLTKFAIPVTAASDIQLDIKANSEVNNLKLSKEEKRNLFLICKETLNNSIKYAEASLITVEIRPYGKKIQINIRDNGKGFDETQVKAGYGLKNIQFRASQVKYKATHSSVPGQGTTVEIKPVG